MLLVRVSTTLLLAWRYRASNFLMSELSCCLQVGLLIGQRSFFNGLKGAKITFLKTGHPFRETWSHPNRKTSKALFARLSFTVEHVLTMSSQPQIHQPVVTRHSVDVVNAHPLWDSSVEDGPDDAMRVRLAVHYYQNDVAHPVIRRPGLPSRVFRVPDGSHSGTGKMPHGSPLPNQNPRFRVALETLFQVVSIRQVVAFCSRLNNSIGSFIHGVFMFGVRSRQTYQCLAVPSF